MEYTKFLIDGIYSNLKRLDTKIKYVKMAILDKRNYRVPNLRYQKRTLLSLEQEIKELEKERKELYDLYLDTVYKVNNKMIMVNDLGFESLLEVE